MSLYVGDVGTVDKGGTIGESGCRLMVGNSGSQRGSEDEADESREEYPTADGSRGGVFVACVGVDRLDCVYGLVRSCRREAEMYDTIASPMK